MLIKRERERNKQEFQTQEEEQINMLPTTG